MRVSADKAGPQDPSALDEEAAGRLWERLREAEETLEAIRSGDVDAVVIGRPNGAPHVYTLETADQTYRALVERMQEGALTLSSDGVVLYCNRRLATLFGVPAERVVGAPLQGFVEEADREALAQMIAAATGKGELMVRTAARISVPANFSFSALAEASPGLSPETLCCVVTDLTEQRRAREALRLAHDRLLVEVAERERTESLLRQSQKMEAIGQLTGGVAHDFNNLLMVISGGLAMMERHTDPDRRARMLEGMRQAAQRGAGLTRQLLAFSRQQALRPEPIDLANQVGGMRELLDRSLGGDISVETEFAEGLWPICVDAGELELVLLNLCVNARDAMPMGGTITLTASNREGRDGRADMVCLAVIDSGTGMPPEVIAHVFEPFFTTKDIGKGSGLGLAQAYGFAKASDGEIEIESEPGRGTTISLLLPRSNQAPDVAQNRAVQAIAEQDPGSAGCALLVEDDAEVAALAKDMLEQLGYQVTQVASAKAALGALADGRGIDLVFSDVMMPGGMNGVELAYEVRRRRTDLPIVLTSGYAEAVRVEAAAAGVQLLSKPYRLDELATALQASSHSP